MVINFRLAVPELYQVICIQNTQYNQPKKRTKVAIYVCMNSSNLHAYRFLTSLLRSLSAQLRIFFNQNKSLIIEYQSKEVFRLDYY